MLDPGAREREAEAQRRLDASNELDRHFQLLVATCTQAAATVLIANSEGVTSVVESAERMARRIRLLRA